MRLLLSYTIKTVLSRFLMPFVAILVFQSISFSQATLSLQGIVKKSNGVALENGTYPITFKIYARDGSPVGALWTETIPNVEVFSGIYSVILGEIESLALPFDEDYDVGISIGSKEMLPRIKMTPAPYALGLRGSTNQFPSSGEIIADAIKLKDGVLASGGTPGLNGANKNGYAFSGNNGDNDSGLYSTADGQVQLYANNVERLKADGQGVTIQGNTTVTDINLSSNGKLIYNGTHADWRLVDVDDFNGGNDEWQVYGPVSGQYTGWNQPTSSGGAPTANGGDFVGNILYPTSNRQVVKKQFSPSGSFSQIKVKFRYYFINSWGVGIGDMPYAGFASDVNSSVFRVGWTVSHAYMFSHNGNFDNTTYYNAANILGSTVNWADHWVDAEMTARANGNSFWVVIGAQLDMNDINDESYAVGSVEIWVR